MAPRPNPTEKERRRAEILEEVLRTHGDQLRRQARYHSVHLQNAEDALDDACVAFLRSYDGEAGTPAVRYMMVVVKTAAWTLDRRQRRLEREKDAGASHSDYQRDVVASVPDLADGPEERYERVEYLRERSALLGKLKPDERTALVLFALGYSYREIGETKGWTHTKVNRCVAEGRERLRQLMATEGERS